jgi:hypothetical protein
MSVIYRRFEACECSVGRSFARDRAAAAATAVLQIFQTAPPDQQQQAIEDYLREEFSDIERQVAAQWDGDHA